MVVVIMAKMVKINIILKNQETDKEKMIIKETILWLHQLKILKNKEQQKNNNLVTQVQIVSHKIQVIPNQKVKVKVLRKRNLAVAKIVKVVQNQRADKEKTREIRRLRKMIEEANVKEKIEKIKTVIEKKTEIDKEIETEIEKTRKINPKREVADLEINPEKINQRNAEIDED